MQKTTMAEGIVYVLPHPVAVCFEPSELQGLAVSYLAQDMQLVAPEEIIQMQPRPLFHRDHLVPIVEQLYNILTYSTLI
jgi:hypothetical protein